MSFPDFLVIKAKIIQLDLPKFPMDVGDNASEENTLINNFNISVLGRKNLSSWKITYNL